MWRGQLNPIFIIAFSDASLTGAAAILYPFSSSPFHFEPYSAVTSFPVNIYQYHANDACPDVGQEVSEAPAENQPKFEWIKRSKRFNQSRVARILLEAREREVLKSAVALHLHLHRWHKGHSGPCDQKAHFRSEPKAKTARAFEEWATHLRYHPVSGERCISKAAERFRNEGGHSQLSEGLVIHKWELSGGEDELDNLRRIRQATLIGRSLRKVWPGEKDLDVRESW